MPLGSSSAAPVMSPGPRSLTAGWWRRRRMIAIMAAARRCGAHNATCAVKVKHFSLIRVLFRIPALDDSGPRSKLNDQTLLSPTTKEYRSMSSMTDQERLLLQDFLQQLARIRNVDKDPEAD